MVCRRCIVGQFTAAALGVRLQTRRRVLAIQRDLRRMRAVVHDQQAADACVIRCISDLRIGAERNIAKVQRVILGKTADAATERRRHIKLERACRAAVKRHMLIGGSTEFQHRRTADSRASRALGISVDGDIAIVRPQATAVDQRTFNHQSAAAAGLQHPRVGDGAATGIDHQRIDAAGMNQA
ncbi:hypothetical protein D9M71_452280 [compost metagenome]